MAEAVVSITLQILGDLLLEEAKFLCGVGSKVKELQIELKEMKCLLEDAEQKQHKSKSVRNWITEIKDLAHRAEDVIEIYAVRVSYNQEMGFKQLFTRFSCACFNGGVLLHNIGSEILRIKTEVARVKKSMEEYGIKAIIEGESSSYDENQRWRRQSHANFEIEDCFVGKEDELERLVSVILDDDKEDRVVSIWGMGGIGKTTICRKVYTHVEVKRCFESFAWVCVTQECRIRSVLEEILKQLTPRKREKIGSLSDRELDEELSKIQKEKRCLIVIDDLWEKDHWDCLKHAFLVEDLSSKILITTRKQSVAEVGFAFEIGLLNVDDGWELLKKKALPRGNIPVEENLLQKLGKEMVHKCGYLPLVVSVLGGVLSKKKSIEGWELVNENINKYLYRGEGLDKENEIHGVLKLSYDDLPYYLKSCFLYMGQFREDQTIYVRTLYRLWIAEGMISGDHNQGDDEMTLVDIAELYLTELASRSLVQVQVEDEVRDQKYSTCRLHDAVRSLCLAKGKNEDFGLQIIQNYQGGNLSTSLGSKTRHLAIHCHNQEKVQLQSDGSGNNVRSLQFINVMREKKIEFPQDILDQKFKLLRVLLIHGCKFKRRKLPKGIANLVHLKYLGLFYCVLDKLPSSIGSLSYLYSLDLLGSWNVRVPNELNKMHRLKHLILPYYNKEKTGNYRLQLDGLEELEILYGFNSLVHDLKSVTRMKNLQRFEAVAHDNESLYAIINAVMSTWKKLRFFKLVIRQVCQFTTEDGLMILKKVFACPNLHDLRIHVGVGKQIHECRSEIIGSRLVRLQLMECEIDEDPMEVLGKLPLLEQLFLSNRSFVGDKMKCDATGFPCLKNLVLKRLPNLREWRVEKGAMHAVSEIEISDCPRLEMVPDEFRFLTTLQKLKICGMPELGRRVLASSDGGREGEDFDKVRRVPFITIVD